MGRHGIPEERARCPLPLRLPSRPVGMPLLRGRGSHPTFVGLVGRHPFFPGRPPAALWGVGQRTAMGMDASLSLPPAVVPVLLPHWRF